MATNPTITGNSALPSYNHYERGKGDPKLVPDNGAGQWNSIKATADFKAKKVIILMQLPAAAVIIGWDASKHLKHYFNNTGSNYWINLESMVHSSLTARERYEDEVHQALAFVEQLPVGSHSIHSTKTTKSQNKAEETRNWFLAIGGYDSWGQGVAVVKEGKGGREYELDFEYKLYKCYNWDKKKPPIGVFGIKIMSDETMGEFHREGLAKEFDCYGIFKRRFTWKKGTPLTPRQLQTPVE